MELRRLRAQRLQKWLDQRLDQHDAEQRTEEERLQAEADPRWDESVAAETAREAKAAPLSSPARMGSSAPTPRGAALAQGINIAGVPVRSVGISVSGGGGGGDASRKASVKKTLLCRHFGLNGFCAYGSYCNFAHGEQELVAFRGPAGHS